MCAGDPGKRRYVWLRDNSVDEKSHNRIRVDTVPGAEKENLCRTYDQPYQGRNRRYYSITDEGKAKLLDYRCQWMDHKNAIDVFLDVKRAKE